MIITTVIFLGVVMITCLIAVAVIPRFDRRPSISQPQPVVAIEPRLSA